MNWWHHWVPPPLLTSGQAAAAELLRIHRQPEELCPAQQCLRLFDEVTYAFQVVVTLSAGDIPVFFGKWEQNVLCRMVAQGWLWIFPPLSCVLQIVQKWLESPELLVATVASFVQSLKSDGNGNGLGRETRLRLLALISVAKRYSTRRKVGGENPIRVKYTKYFRWIRLVNMLHDADGGRRGGVVISFFWQSAVWFLDPLSLRRGVPSLRTPRPDPRCGTGVRCECCQNCIPVWANVTRCSHAFVLCVGAGQKKQIHVCFSLFVPSHQCCKPPNISKMQRPKIKNKSLWHVSCDLRRGKPDGEVKHLCATTQCFLGSLKSPDTLDKIFNKAMGFSPLSSHR